MIMLLLYKVYAAASLSTSVCASTSTCWSNFTHVHIFVCNDTSTYNFKTYIILLFVSCSSTIGGFDIQINKLIWSNTGDYKIDKDFTNKRKKI